MCVSSQLFSLCLIAFVGMFYDLVEESSVCLKFLEFSDFFLTEVE